ncbi:hypothetical protein [Mucilaginibacter pallidiroseus]|nr:hypothetical protein [Mucilaginibacter pallidiroseus]
MENLARQVKVLQLCVAVLFITVVALVINQFVAKQTAKELTLERLNIVDSTGTLRMVISNKQKQHPGAVDGKAVAPRERDAGLIFFNDEGDECGGLIYSGNKKEASMVYSIDQFKNDQIMQLQYAQQSDGANNRSYGFKLWDRSDAFRTSQLLKYADSLKGLHNQALYDDGINKLKAKGYLGVERLFLGKTKTGQTGLFLKDANGKPRLTICIDSLNQPVIQTLGDNGEVVATLGGK